MRNAARLSKRSDEAQVIKDARDKLKKVQAEQRESLKQLEADQREKKEKRLEEEKKIRARAKAEIEKLRNQTSAEDGSDGEGGDMGGDGETEMSSALSLGGRPLRSSDAIYRHVPPQSAKPGFKYPDMDEMVQHVANKTRWGVAHHLDRDGTFLLEAVVPLDGAHRGMSSYIEPPDRLTDGLSLVLLDEGEKEFMGPNGTDLLADSSEDGFFMMRLSDDNAGSWAQSDVAQERNIQQTGAQYPDYTVAVDSDITITGIPYRLGPGPRTPAGPGRAGWVPEVKEPSPDNLETITFQSISKICVARNKNVGCQMLAYGDDHNNTSIDYADAKECVNNMLRERVGIAGTWQLAKYVDHMCQGKPTRGARRGEAEGGKIQGYTPYKLMSFQNASALKRAAGRASQYNRGSSWRRDGRELPRDDGGPAQEFPAVNGDFAHQPIINVGDFGEELLSWSHWAYLDASPGNKEPIKPKDPKKDLPPKTHKPNSQPRGSCFVRYVDWWDQYEKYPATPIMRPDACTDLTKWEAYMSMFRQYQLQHETFESETNCGEFDVDAFLHQAYRQPSAHSASQGHAPESVGYQSEWEDCLPPGWTPSLWAQTTPDLSALRANTEYKPADLLNALPPELRQAKTGSSPTETVEQMLEHQVPGSLWQEQRREVFHGQLAYRRRRSQWVRRGPRPQADEGTLRKERPHPRSKTGARSQPEQPSQAGQAEDVARRQARGPHRLPLRHRGVLGRRRASVWKGDAAGRPPLAEGLGVRRVMLSALSRTWWATTAAFWLRADHAQRRSLDFLSQHYVRTKPGDRYAGLDVYHSKQLKEVDLIDRARRVPSRGPGPVMVGTCSRKPACALTTTAQIFMEHFYNWRVPYYYAHAFFDVDAAPQGRGGGEPRAPAGARASAAPAGSRRRRRGRGRSGRAAARMPGRSAGAAGPRPRSGR